MTTNREPIVPTEVEQPLSVQLEDGDDGKQQHESYYQLVWQRFKKSKAAILGGLMVLLLIILAVFADFFSPVDPHKADLRSSHIPPSKIHFFDEEGNFYFRPFTYNQTIGSSLGLFLQPII